MLTWALAYMAVKGGMGVPILFLGSIVADVAIFFPDRRRLRRLAAAVTVGGSKPATSSTC